MSQLKERYRRVVVGEVSCFERVVINGTPTEICHTGAVAQYLMSRKERLLDLQRVFEPVMAEIVASANAVATAHGLSKPMFHMSRRIRFRPTANPRRRKLRAIWREP